MEIRMLDWSVCSAVNRSPRTGSGQWLFAGTRVPVVALFQNLEDEATVQEFLEWFSGVSQEQVEAVLEFTEKSLLLEHAVCFLFCRARFIRLRHSRSVALIVDGAHSF